MRLVMVLYAMIGTALAGSAMVLVLTLGYITPWSIIGAAAVGAVVAMPVSWLVARQIDT
jgi:hypothetical protein